MFYTSNASTSTHRRKTSNLRPAMGRHHGKNMDRPARPHAHTPHRPSPPIRRTKRNTHQRRRKHRLSVRHIRPICRCRHRPRIHPRQQRQPTLPQPRPQNTTPHGTATKAPTVVLHLMGHLPKSIRPIPLPKRPDTILQPFFQPTIKHNAPPCKYSSYS